ncbi:MAG: hypothetical protein JHC31_02365 [Sulfurihydrogenibium sp.]|nr:hypothetical protein [Sulfurihydrogenibium sp.]
MGIWYRFIVSQNGIKPLASDTPFSNAVSFKDNNFNYEVDLELESCSDINNEFILDIAFEEGIIVIEPDYCNEPIFLPCNPKKLHGVIIFRLRLKGYLIKITVREV